MKLTLPSSKQFFGLLFLAFCCLSGSAWAQNTEDGTKNNDSIRHHIDVLAEEASSIARKLSDISEQREQLNTRIAELALRSIEQTKVERARLDVETQNAEMKSIKLDIMTAEQQKEALITSITSLKNNLQTLTSSQPNETIKNEIIQTQKSLSDKEILLELGLKQISVLGDRKQLVFERLRLKEQWLTEIQKTYKNQQEQLREQNFEEIEKQLGEERAIWQQKAREYSAKLDQYNSAPL